MGDLDGQEIVKKKGPYGFYLQWGELRIPYQEDETLVTICGRFRARAKTAASQYEFGPYVFASGEYGPYMYKKDTGAGKTKTRIFVSIPSTVDVRKLTGEEADALYKNGLEAKKAGGGGRGGRGCSRGGFRGRGRGRAS